MWAYWLTDKLRSLTEIETLAQVRDSLIHCRKDGYYTLKIAGHARIVYQEWDEAVEKLEEILGLRPFTLDV